MFQIMIDQMELAGKANPPPKDKRFRSTPLTELQGEVLKRLQGANKTPQQLADELDAPVDTITRAVRVLSDQELITCIRPVNKGNLKRPALWTAKNAS